MTDSDNKKKMTEKNDIDLSTSSRDIDRQRQQKICCHADPC